MIRKKTSSKSVKISKFLIENSPLFIDLAVKTLICLTELDVEKSTHNIGVIRNDIDDVTLSSVMKFDGDITGLFFLVFPKSVAVRALIAFVGEAIDEDDREGLKDGVGEFCNIITGSIKMKLQEKDINIKFELPKNFDSMKQAKKVLQSHEGIWVDMLLDQDPFYIFLTQ